jgi:hypothetical protein
VHDLWVIFFFSSVPLSNPKQFRGMVLATVHCSSYFHQLFSAAPLLFAELSQNLADPAYRRANVDAKQIRSNREAYDTIFSIS